MLPGAPHEESLVSRVLTQGFGSLRFPEPLEQEFRQEHLLAHQRWVRMSLLVALGTTIGFAIIDHWVIRSSNAIPDIARFGLQLPILIIALLATIRRFYVRWYRSTAQIGAPLFGVGSVLMVAYAQPEHAAMVGSRLLLVTFFFYFMIGMRVWPAVRSNAIVFAALVIAAMQGAPRTEVATYLAFAMVCANVIGAAGAYALEHANRTAFLERKLLIEVAELDGLTRLLNRQTFESRVREVWQQASRNRQPVTVVMVDVDHFKAYNDHYGHQAGDECLRKVAMAVRKAVCSRPDDFVARYGGEEMIAVLSGRSAADALEIAENIVREIESLEIVHMASDLRRVSVSVGAATHLPPFSGGCDALIRQADGALYAAKRQGRNRCVAVECRASAAA